MTYFIPNYYIELMYLYEIISIRKVISLSYRFVEILLTPFLAFLLVY
jgi:hypothetical protein